MKGSVVGRIGRTSSLFSRSALGKATFRYGLPSFHFIALLAAFFYLFILPAMVASDPAGWGWWGVAFGAFLLAQLFLIVFTMAMDSAYVMYFSRRYEMPFFDEIHRRLGNRPLAIRSERGIAMMFVSYALFLYAYAVLYSFISHVEPQAFGLALSIADSLYFSVITAATVGFGDITPGTWWSRGMVVSQVLLSVFYVVLLFSATATVLHGAKATAQNPRQLKHGKKPLRALSGTPILTTTLSQRRKRRGQ